MYFKKVSAMIIVALCFFTFNTAWGKDATLAVKEGDKIAFLGDSITAGGVRKFGYVTLVMQALNNQGLMLTHVPAGISGHKSSNMLARVDKDVISKKPHWMT